MFQCQIMLKKNEKLLAVEFKFKHVDGLQWFVFL